MPCPDCQTHKIYILGFLMILTVFLTALIIFDYIAKASSIEEYDKLSKECNNKIAEANRQIAKCASQPEQDEVQFPELYYMNCSGVSDEPD